MFDFTEHLNIPNKIMKIFDVVDIYREGLIWRNMKREEIKKFISTYLTKQFVSENAPKGECDSEAEHILKYLDSPVNWGVYINNPALDNILEPIKNHDSELLRRVSEKLREAPILAENSIEYAVGEMLYRAILYLIDEDLKACKK